MKRVLATTAVLGLVGLGSILLSSPAQATEQTNCPTWQMRGVTGAYPEVTFGDAPAGSSVNADGAKLVKPATGTQPGVEFAAYDVDLHLSGSADITVHYKLADGATTDAGAIRMFYYHNQLADTINIGPTAFVVADSSEGTLSISASGDIGTLGFAYDASNASTGSVTFSDLHVGDIPVSFTKEACTPPASESPSPSPTHSSAKPTSTHSGAVAVPTTPGRNAAPTLPVTGSRTGLYVAGGGALVVAGMVFLFVIGRRRRGVEFRA